MKKLISKGKIYLEFFMWLAVFLTTTSLFRIVLDTEWADSIFGPTCFLFAILLAFSTSNRKQRLDTIRTNLRKCDAIFVQIYELAKKMPKKEMEKVKAQIDATLIAQIDYKLVDIDMTIGENIKLMELIDGLKVTEDLEDHKETMYELATELFEISKEISYRVKDRIKALEWICLSLLVFVILMVLNSFNIGTILSIGIISLLSTCVMLLLVFLREMDNLAWQEKEWIWNPLIDLFHELDLLPYFPGDLYDARKITISHLKPMDAYRIAIYKNPYPDNSNKEIKTIQVKK